MNKAEEKPESDIAVFKDMPEVYPVPDILAPTAAQAKKQQHTFALVLVVDIAMWTDYRSKAAIRLTERGDILFFRNRKLIFAQILSRWRHFPHGAIMEEIFSEEISQEEKEVGKTVYLTLPDMAFDGRAARIGILDDRRKIS